MLVLFANSLNTNQNLKNTRSDHGPNVRHSDDKTESILIKARIQKTTTTKKQQQQQTNKQTTANS